MLANLCATPAGDRGLCLLAAWGGVSVGCLGLLRHKPSNAQIHVEFLRISHVVSTMGVPCRGEFRQRRSGGAAIQIQKETRDD